MSHQQQVSASNQRIMLLVVSVLQMPTSPESTDCLQRQINSDVMQKKLDNSNNRKKKKKHLLQGLKCIQMAAQLHNMHIKTNIKQKKLLHFIYHRGRNWYLGIQVKSELSISQVEVKNSWISSLLCSVNRLTAVCNTSQQKISQRSGYFCIILTLSDISINFPQWNRPIKSLFWSLFLFICFRK